MFCPHFTITPKFVIITIVCAYISHWPSVYVRSQFFLIYIDLLTLQVSEAPIIEEEWIGASKQFEMIWNFQTVLVKF